MKRLPWNPHPFSLPPLSSALLSSTSATPTSRSRPGPNRLHAARSPGASTASPGERDLHLETSSPGLLTSSSSGPLSPWPVLPPDPKERASGLGLESSSHCTLHFLYRGFLRARGFRCLPLPDDSKSHLCAHRLCPQPPAHFRRMCNGALDGLGQYEASP